MPNSFENEWQCFDDTDIYPKSNSGSRKWGSGCMDEFEARSILTQNRQGKTFTRDILEQARNVVREKQSIGSVIGAAKR